MSPNQLPPLTKSELDKELRTALNGLYDPAVLRGSPLVAWFGGTQLDNPISALRRVLLEGIEALHPQEKMPSGSKTWRVYHILRRRYTEQILQRQVADDLGISLRQLQREDKFAREMLRDILWKTYQLEGKAHPSSSISTPQPGKVLEPPGDPTDLGWLRDTLPVQGVNIHEVIQDGLLTLKGVLDTAGVTVDYQPKEHPPQLYLQTALLRQGLLNLLNSAIAQVPGGKITIQTHQQAGTAHIVIEAQPSSSRVSLISPENSESLEIARSFLTLCNGSLHIADSTGSPAFHAAIALPIAERRTVLVIEDHADTLQLFQRYLSDSHYYFVGASSVRQGLALAEEIVPHLIVLDVMMPESDGWAFLGQLRVHPKTQNVPVIVCSIIPQANLALSLGAVEFLRKPVSRAELLAALDRQMSQLLRGSG